MNDGIAGGAKRLEDLGGLLGRSFRLVQRHLAAGEVVALDVDDDESSGHSPNDTRRCEHPLALGTTLGLQPSVEEVNDKRPAYSRNRV